MWTRLTGMSFVAAMSLGLVIGCSSEAPKPVTPAPESHAEHAPADGHKAEHADGHKEGHGHGASAEEMQAEVAKLASYAEAIHEIGEHREEIEHLIKDDKLDKVHPSAEHISLIAKRLFELARTSKVSEEHWKDINTQSRELANLFDEVDEAADAGKKPETEAAVAKMFKLIDSLTAFAPPADKGEQEEKK